MALNRINTNWQQGSYQLDVRFLIKKSENINARTDAHFDGGDSIAIGYGYDLLLHSEAEVSAALNGIVTLTQAQINALASARQQRDARNVTGVQQTASTLNLNLPSVGAADTLLDNVLATEYTPRLDTLLSSYGVALPPSRERVALLSLVYNGNLTQNIRSQYYSASTLLLSALNSGNRAEAWFQIRYRLRRTSNASIQNGYAARGYAEAATFSLYDDPPTTATTIGEPEAKSIYRMYTLHQDEMIDRDEAFAAQIIAANTTFGLTGMNAAKPLIDSLRSAGEFLITKYVVQPGYGTLSAISILNVQVGSDNSESVHQGSNNADLIMGEAGDDKISGLGGADILYGGSENDFITGGAGDDMLLGGVGVDTLIGGADKDTLIGGADDDKLQGGLGSDTYIRGINDGKDTILDEDGQGKIFYAGQDLTGDKTQVAGETTLFTDGTHNYRFIGVPGQPGQLKITRGDDPNGQIIVERFKSGDLGIIIPPLAAIVTTNKSGDAQANILTADAPNQNVYGLAGNDRIHVATADSSAYMNAKHRGHAGERSCFSAPRWPDPKRKSRRTIRGSSRMTAASFIRLLA